MFSGILKAVKKHKIFMIVVVVIGLLYFSVNAFAEESSLVTQSDGKSYDGLPDFPVKHTDKGSQGMIYVKFHNYVLYKNTSTGEYYLVCSPSENDLYLSGNKLCYDGGYAAYYSDYSAVNYQCSSCSFSIYKCGEGATSWTYYTGASGGIINVNYCDTLLQSSCNIYTDSSMTTVFTESAAEMLISTLSSTKIVQILKSQIVGSIPLVIGFLVCLMGFFKGWKMLSQEFRAS